MSGASRHEHWFSLIPTHFGPYGDQSVHYHVCIEDEGECGRVLMAEGRNCDGKRESHRRVTLGEKAR